MTSLPRISDGSKQPQESTPYLHNLHHNSEFGVTEVHSVGVVPILCHHGGQQMDDIITFHFIIVPTLVVHCKLRRDGQNDHHPDVYTP